MIRQRSASAAAGASRRYAPYARRVAAFSRLNLRPTFASLRLSTPANATMPDAQTPATPRPRACLVVLDGAVSVETIDLDLQPVVIGRGAACAVRVGARGVSRRHCAVWQDDAGIWVLDLASRNGTYVDGRLLVFGPVSFGCIVQLGCPAQAAFAVRRKPA